MHTRSARRSHLPRTFATCALVAFAPVLLPAQGGRGLEGACTTVSAAATRLATIRRVYVAELGTAKGADALRDALRTTLTGAGGFELVHDSLEADAVLRGSGEATRSDAVATATTADGSIVTDAMTPRYRGVLHLELRTRAGDAELWRYDATEDQQLRPQGEPMARRAVMVLHARARLAARCARLQRERAGPSA